MTSVLYDLPGPKARRRNMILSVVSTVGIVALVAFVVWKFNATGQFEARKWEQFQYASVQRELLAGLWATLKAAGMAAVLALLFGAVFASARLSDKWFLRSPATFVVELFRAIPLLILIFFGYYVSLQYGWPIDKLWALVIGLMLYNGSVLAEIFRAGINAVPYGQTEGAYAIGMRKNQVLRLILLPQAFRSMLPAIVSQLVVLLKDTALGFIITYPELLFVGKQIGGRLPFGLPYVPTYLLVAAIYISICGLLSLFAWWLQRRLGRMPRTAAKVMPAQDTGADAARMV
ncbi:amino acid ABC transporter permease [Micromonospora sagamiensis]|uniref:Amino acid ABC transporter membrane protein 2, PAAT family (TC 3.A.1.3.-) n=1 Tax=Micromonospora sagamiensis TaxID=47875 RepID=A0A562WKP5_9ACTN|nr:amino acid ABC transporter permease [Micromonospora sagamiensis]TWJ30611.1 amino acid ABC transporter membrane protein 2, PAAT family (TC 3.A.1.3.-) [Micromonospora sagamiensis]BCL16357.1 amino acid ABC transporter permease [Micromonospora sagamiensis]